MAVLDATGPDGRRASQGHGKRGVRYLSEEVRSMLLNKVGTKAIVYVTQPYLNLNYAGELRKRR